jgi:hypothetical protein
VRALFGIVAGIVTGVVLVFAVEMASSLIYPVPSGVNTADPAAMAAHVATLPVAAKLMVLFAWGLGSFAAGAVAARAARRGEWPGWVAGAIPLLAGIVTMMQAPHPVWMVIVGMLVLTLPAIIAARLFARDFRFS